MKFVKALSRNIKKAAHNIVKAPAKITPPKMPGPKIPEIDMPNPLDVVKDVGEGVLKTGGDILEGVDRVVTDVVDAGRSGDIMRVTEKLQNRAEKAQTRYETAHQDALDETHENIQAQIELRSLSMIHETARLDRPIGGGVGHRDNSERVVDVDTRLEETATTRLIDDLGLHKTSDRLRDINKLLPVTLISDFLLFTPHMIGRQFELAEARKQLRKNIKVLRNATNETQAYTARLRKETIEIEAEIARLEDEIEELGLSPEEHAPTVLRIEAAENEAMIAIAKSLFANGTHIDTIAAITKLPMEELVRLQQAPLG